MCVCVCVCKRSTLHILATSAPSKPSVSQLTQQLESVETQEGPACGLLKAFALGARVTYGQSASQNRAMRDELVVNVFLVEVFCHQKSLANRLSWQRKTTESSLAKSKRPWRTVATTFF